MEKQKDEQQEKMTLGRIVKSTWFPVKMVFSIVPFQSVIYLVLETISAVRQVIYSFLFAYILDELISLATQKSKDISVLYPSLFLLFISYFIIQIIFSIRLYFRRQILKTLELELFRKLYFKLYELGVQAYDHSELSNLLSRVRNNISNISDVFFELTSFVSSFAVVISAGFVLFRYLPLLIPILMILAIIKLIPIQYLNRKRYDWVKEKSEENRRMYNYGWFLSLYEYVAEITILNAFDYFDQKFTKFKRRYNKEFNAHLDFQLFSMTLLNFLDFSIDIFAYIYIFTIFLAGNITIGLVTFYKKIYESFSSSLSDLFGTIAKLGDYAIQNVEIIDFFNTAPYITNGVKKLRLGKGSPSMEFKNVSFHYPNSKKNLFKRINLEIKSGEKVAIVGHNGAGKTTFVKLLSRIYDPTEGKILINNQDLKELDIRDWYMNLAIMFQEYHVFSMATAGENIALGDISRDPDKEKIVKAAQNADANDFIQEYSKKYEEVMSSFFKGGTEPSTGQKQKLALARFFYRNAPFVIFDEPTSAIDAIAEYKIFNKIYEFFKEKTVVIISHRFSTVRNADRIIVMDKGRIVEQGSHLDLMKNNGLYAKSFRLQAEGYREVEETKSS